MRKIPIIVSTLALAAVSLGAPAPAGAAGSTTFGNACIADDVTTNVTLVQIASGPSNSLPAAAQMAGVITKATFGFPGVPTAYPQAVKVMRPTGVANQFTTVAQSSPLPVAGGTTAFDVRIPIKAGDHLGVYGPTMGSLSCTAGTTGDVLGSVANDQGPGTTATYATTANASVPLVATIEADADGDGFGDVTQDLCPGSAATQAACPNVASFAVTSGNQITVLVTADGATSVTVAGLAKVNGKKFKLKGGTKSVTSGAIVSFKVKVPAALAAALAKIPAGKTIKVKLTATGSVAGPHSTDSSSVKLHGTHR